jgi:hypothetical protein
MLRKILGVPITQKNPKTFPLARTAENRACPTACAHPADTMPEERSNQHKAIDENRHRFDGE